MSHVEVARHACICSGASQGLACLRWRGSAIEGYRRGEVNIEGLQEDGFHRRTKSIIWLRACITESRRSTHLVNCTYWDTLASLVMSPHDSDNLDALYHILGPDGGNCVSSAEYGACKVTLSHCLWMSHRLCIRQRGIGSTEWDAKLAPTLGCVYSMLRRRDHCKGGWSMPTPAQSTRDTSVHFQSDTRCGTDGTE